MIAKRPISSKVVVKLYNIQGVTECLHQKKLGDRPRKIEQLFQVKFSDFPIGSPDTGRKSRKSPLFDAKYLGNGKCYDNDSCGLV